eukprot:scaffold32352_cov54-Phaeocystis_antarctica.AAC.1
MAQAERKLHAKVGLSRLPARRPMVEQHVWEPEQARAANDVERRLAQAREEIVVVTVGLEPGALGTVVLDVPEPHHIPTRRVVDPACAPSLLRGTAGGGRLIH